VLPDICHDGPGDSDLGMPVTSELARPAGDPADRAQAPVLALGRAGRPSHDCRDGRLGLLGVPQRGRPAGTILLALLITLVPIRRAVRLRPGTALRYA
jgi:hypothetical protein